jgi:N-acetylneuraminic acid mutarotase
MRTVPICIACYFTGCLLLSCKDDNTTVVLVGNWVKRSDFEGVARSEAIAFTVGDKSYVGLGFDGKTRLTDLWEYNLDKDYWTQKANFTGVGRTNSTAFSTDTKGYVGTGSDGENYLKDIWEYNPETNMWKRKADFGGTSRSDAVSFGINNKGYLGTGYDGNYLKDFWQFDPVDGDSGSWKQIASVGGSKREGATTFTIDGKAYVCCGINNGSFVSDFWMFDPSTVSWTEKRQISNVSDQTYDDNYNIVRQYGTAFVISSKAYLTGGISSSLLNDTWEYDPGTDLWTKKAAFEGSSRYNTVSFSVGNRGFITTGRSSSYRFDDCWEFQPENAADAND